MQKINGKYVDAVIYSSIVEDYAIAQIKMICDNEAAASGRFAPRITRFP